MERLLSRALTRAGLMISSIFLGMVALGFIIAAVYLALLPLGAPWLAAAGTGGLSLVTALVCALVASRPGGRRTLPAADPGSAAEVAVGLGQSLGMEVERRLKDHKRQVVLAAFAGGFALGVSPRLRRSLWRLLGTLSLSSGVRKR